LTCAGTNVDVARSELSQDPGIVQVREIIHRIVEVEIVVVHPVHGIAQVVNAGERVAALHVVGMLEEGVGRVISAERCAVGGGWDAGRLTHRVDKGENFAGYVVVVLRLHPTAMEGMRSLVCERIALHSVNGEKSDAPLLDVRAKCADHALAFLFMLVAHAGREGEKGHAVIPVDVDAHVAAETV